MKYYNGIDIARVIAAFLVICIHTDPLMSYSESGNYFLVSVVARLAVPFFFFLFCFWFLFWQKNWCRTIICCWFQSIIFKFEKIDNYLYRLVTYLFSNSIFSMDTKRWVVDILVNVYSKVYFWRKLLHTLVSYWINVFTYLFLYTL